MANPIVSINIAVHNGEKYILHCLNSIKSQTFKNFEINIWDNNSKDNTVDIIKNGLGFPPAFDFAKGDVGRGRISDLGFARFSLIENSENLGMWPAQEKLLLNSNGKYIAVISSDIVWHQDFLKNAVEIMEKNDKIGAIQPKVLTFYLAAGESIFTDIIDTLGFQIFKSRRIVNIGHGENVDKFIEANSEFNNEKEIFAVEGACPIFRKKSLEDCRINSELIDKNMFWYGDDLDLAWRMRNFGWKHIYSPMVVAWHDRQTTKTLRKSLAEFIKIRRGIPIFKRRLDWRNTRLAIIKNDFLENLVKDLPYIIKRELMLLGYIIFFEPQVLLEIPKLFQLLPRTLRKRSEVMKKIRINPKEFRKCLD